VFDTRYTYLAGYGYLAFQCVHFLARQVSRICYGGWVGEEVSLWISEEGEVIWESPKIQ
jgi:hypothetical protein